MRLAAVKFTPRPPSFASTRIAWHSSADVELKCWMIEPRSPPRACPPAKILWRIPSRSRASDKLANRRSILEEEKMMNCRRK